MNADHSWRVKMHYYPFHIGDFKSSTPHLSDPEELCYRRLLDELYDLGGLLPLDLARVARKLRTEVETLRVVVSEFLDETPDGYTQKRCDKEVAKYAKLLESKASAGKASGKSRAQKGTRVQQVFNGCSTDVQQVFNGCSTEVEQNRTEGEQRLNEIEQKGNEIELTKNQEPRTNSPDLVRSGSAEGAANAALTPKAKRSDAQEIPTALDTPAFREMWERWCVYRIEKRAKLTPSTISGQFSKLEKLGVTLAIETLQNSIDQGWTGFFPEKQGQQPQATKSGRQAMTFATADEFNVPCDSRGIPLSLGLGGLEPDPVIKADSEPLDF